jgi:hypothetical protein
MIGELVSSAFAYVLLIVQYIIGVFHTRCQAPEKWETHLLPFQQAGYITLWSERQLYMFTFDEGIFANDLREVMNRKRSSTSL